MTIIITPSFSRYPFLPSFPPMKSEMAMHKLTTHHIDCKSRISGVVNFVTGNLRPVKSETDPDLSTWYRRNSLVYVADNHACWSNEDLFKKISKRRFGRVLRSPHQKLGAMMDEHADDVHAFILERLTPPDDDKDGDHPDGNGDEDEPPAKSSRAPVSAAPTPGVGRSGETTEEDKDLAR